MLYNFLYSTSESPPKFEGPGVTLPTTLSLSIDGPEYVNNALINVLKINASTALYIFIVLPRGVFNKSYSKMQKICLSVCLSVVFHTHLAFAVLQGREPRRRRLGLRYVRPRLAFIFPNGQLDRKLSCQVTKKTFDGK